MGSGGYVQGYLAHEKLPPPPYGHHRALGIVLPQGRRGSLFLMSEVHLYALNCVCFGVGFQSEGEREKRVYYGWKPIDTVLNLNSRTIAVQKCAAIPRRARI